jgi:hypothetical protein
MAIEYKTKTDALAVTPENVKDVIASLKNQISNTERSKGNLMVAGAYATHAVCRVRGEAFKVAKYADEVGIDRTSVYGWMRLGVCAVDLDFEPNTDDWTRLAGRNGAISFPLAGILDGKGRDNKSDKGTHKPTRDDVEWALAIMFEPVTDADGEVVKDENGNPVLSTDKKKAAEIKAAHAAALGLTPVVDEEDAQKGLDKRADDAVTWLKGNLHKVSDPASVIDALMEVVKSQAVREALQAKRDADKSDDEKADEAAKAADAA